MPAIFGALSNPLILPVLRLGIRISRRTRRMSPLLRIVVIGRTGRMRVGARVAPSEHSEKAKPSHGRHGTHDKIYRLAFPRYPRTYYGWLGAALYWLRRGTCFLAWPKFSIPVSQTLLPDFPR